MDDKSKTNRSFLRKHGKGFASHIKEQTMSKGLIWESIKLDSCIIVYVFVKTQLNLPNKYLGLYTKYKFWLLKES